MKSKSAATNRPTLGPVTFGIRKLRRAPQDPLVCTSTRYTSETMLRRYPTWCVSSALQNLSNPVHVTLIIGDRLLPTVAIA